MESLIQHYGYLAVLLGTFVEGETILILAGFAAHRGYLELHWVILAAFLGSLSGDQLFFYLGYRHSQFLLKIRPGWEPQLKRAQSLIKKHQIGIILIFRFLYSMRTITPFALGISRIKPRLFIPLNILGALLWAVAFGWAGYLFGQALQVVLGNIKRYEHWAFAVIAIGGLAGWAIYHFWWIRRQK